MGFVPPVYQLLLLFLGQGYSVVILVQLFHSTAVACFSRCAGDVAMPPCASRAPASLHHAMVLLSMSQTISQDRGIKVQSVNGSP